MKRPLSQQLTRMVYLVLLMAPVVSSGSVVPPPPDEEGELWRVQAEAGMRATWERLVSALIARDKAGASLFIHPNRRAEFLSKSPEDLTKIHNPMPVGKQPWTCSIAGREPIANCKLRYMDRKGAPDQMDIPFVVKDGVWYVTF
jgi:hypothetical protein